MHSVIVHALKLFAVVAILTMAIISPGNMARTQAGANFVVDTTTDSGPGSFRQALIDAGTAPGGDTITFDPAVFPPGGDTTITSTANYVVEGDAASQPLTIDGTGAVVVFDMQFADSGDAGFHFRPPGPFSGLTMRNLVINNFHPDSGGHGLEIGFQVTDVSDVLIDHVVFRGHDGHGINLNAAGSMTNVTITTNNSSDNTAHGILLNAGSLDDIEISNNEVHRNEGHGIEVKADSSSVPATVTVANNNVTGNGLTGIGIYTETVGPHVTITSNTTTANGGLGIDLGGGNEDSHGVTANDQGDGDDGPNNLLNFPVINTVAGSGIVGTACANCTVELFIADSDSSGHGEGGGYFATGTADGDGNFDISGCGQNSGANVTATATDPNGNTSEFAENYILPTTPPCPHINGDLDCDEDVDGRDALIAVIHDAGATQITRDPGCPELGSALPASQPASTTTGPTIFGDVNCDLDVGAGDGITILQDVVEVSLIPDPPAGCIPVGEPLTG
jgi:hypothetical protein